VLPLDVDIDSLVRVDVPDWPGAEVSSDEGSVLLEPPPAGTRWRTEPVPRVDSLVGGEAIEALDAAPWHDAGIRGAGVKVAVFDVQWFGADTLDALADYPRNDCYTHRSCEAPFDPLRPRYSFETGQHGVACAEIVATLAPDAEIHLVRLNGLTTLENAVDWAVREGIDVVSMSLSFFNESFYDGTGAVNAAMDELAAGGVQMVVSAGNYAQDHYADTFRDEDVDDRHEFPWASEYLAIELPPGPATIYLSWDEFGRACGTTDLDAYVYDQDGNVVGRSTTEQDRDADKCEPVERPRVDAPEEGWYYLSVVRKAGPASGVRFQVLSQDGSIYRAVPEGSVTDPGSSPTVLTVGAVNAVGYLDNAPESFSSTGPTASGLAKPDVLGPDGLSSSVYGSRGFFGTSAATPAVAGAVALLLSEDPLLLPEEAAERIRGHAVDFGPAWGAPTAGYARLPAPGTGGESGCAGRAAVLLPLVLLARRRRSGNELR
jgi:subtilisin family serine protease